LFTAFTAKQYRNPPTRGALYAGKSAGRPRYAANPDGRHSSMRCRPISHPELCLSHLSRGWRWLKLAPDNQARFRCRRCAMRKAVSGLRQGLRAQRIFTSLKQNRAFLHTRDVLPRCQPMHQAKADMLARSGVQPEHEQQQSRTPRPVGGGGGCDRELSCGRCRTVYGA